VKEHITFWLETQYGEKKSTGNKSVCWRIILKWDFENRLVNE
jgi:hypothetical protein